MKGQTWPFFYYSLYFVVLFSVQLLNVLFLFADALAFKTILQEETVFVSETTDRKRSLSLTDSKPV